MSFCNMSLLLAAPYSLVSSEVGSVRSGVRSGKLSRTGTKRKRREAETDGHCATALTLSLIVFTDTTTTL